jgi:hypothetical protein
MTGCSSVSDLPGGCQSLGDDNERIKAFVGSLTTEQPSIITQLPGVDSM